MSARRPWRYLQARDVREIEHRLRLHHANAPKRIAHPNTVSAISSGRHLVRARLGAGQQETLS
jgi:hypothetical protein